MSPGPLTCELQNRYSNEMQKRDTVNRYYAKRTAARLEKNAAMLLELVLINGKRFKV